MKNDQEREAAISAYLWLQGDAHSKMINVWSETGIDLGSKSLKIKC